MRTHRRIGLVFDHQIGFCRQILNGIKQYSLLRQNWILFNSGNSIGSLRQLLQNEPEGIIAFVFGPSQFKLLSNYGVPIVNVCGAMRDSIPRVGLEDDEIGVLAAEHFIACGLKNLAYIGHQNHEGAIRREKAFCRRAIESKCHVSTFRATEKFGSEVESAKWTRDRKFLSWLKELSKPVGIFVLNDSWGMQLASICQVKRILVPAEVAILGLDNDELVCGLSTPRLSSIAVPSERIGWEAARLLESLLRTKKKPKSPVLLPPIGVVTRETSGPSSISNPIVAAAVEFIQNSACESITVSDIIEAVGVSRSTLERLFKEARGKTLGDEIREVQFGRATTLLIESAVSIKEIAIQCGFTRVNQFCVAFRKAFKCTPSEYRSKYGV